MITGKEYRKLWNEFETVRINGTEWAMESCQKKHVGRKKEVYRPKKTEIN